MLSFPLDVHNSASQSFVVQSLGPSPSLRNMSGPVASLTISPVNRGYGRLLEGSYLTLYVLEVAKERGVSFVFTIVSNVPVYCRWDPSQ